MTAPLDEIQSEYFRKIRKLGGDDMTGDALEAARRIEASCGGATPAKLSSISDALIVARALLAGEAEAREVALEIVDNPKGYSLARDVAVREKLIPRITAAITAARAPLVEIIRFLIDELENRDGYSPGIASCPECTVGTVPDNLNKGLCLYHQALNIVGKP